MNEFRLHKHQQDILHSYIRSIGILNPRLNLVNDEFMVARSMISSLPVSRDLSDDNAGVMLIDPILKVRHNHRKQSSASAEEAEREAFNAVVDFLQSLPRKYEVVVDLPFFPFWGEYEEVLARDILMRSMRLEPAERVQPAAVTMADLFNQEAKQNLIEGSVQLVFQVSGYLDESLDNHVAVEVLSKLKQLLFIFGESESINSDRWSGNSVRLKTLDILSGNLVEIELPSLLARHVGGLRINGEKFKYREGGPTLLGQILRSPNTDEERIAALIGNR